MRGRLSRELCRQKGHCRWCSEPVPKGRYSWCSDECVEAYQVEAWPAVTRHKLTERDHEVCLSCGRDCGRIARYIEAILSDPRAVPRHVWDTEAEQYRNLDPDPVAAGRRQRWIGLLRRLGLVTSDHRYYGAAYEDITLRHLWEADHIHAVVLGGHNGLDNYRTLCWPCHRRETARLACERASARRANVS